MTKYIKHIPISKFYSYYEYGELDRSEEFKKLSNSWQSDGTLKSLSAVIMRLEEIASNDLEKHICRNIRITIKNLTAQFKDGDTDYALRQQDVASYLSSLTRSSRQSGS